MQLHACLLRALCLLPLVIPSCAEAPCKQVVQIAKAAVQEHRDVSRALQEFARVPEKNAEEYVHKLFRKYNLTIDMKPQLLNVGEGELATLPYIRFSSWVRYLMDQDLLSEHLCGVTSERMPGMLTEFWQRYKAVHGSHELFSLPNINLAECLPVFSHVDEGRTYKKQGILVLSVHGAIGKGTRSYKRRVGVRRLHIKQDGMGLNYSGSSWGTQFMFCSLLRSAYAKDMSPLNRVLEAFAVDMATLGRVGASRSAFAYLTRFALCVLL